MNNFEAELRNIVFNQKISFQNATGNHTAFFVHDL